MKWGTSQRRKGAQWERDVVNIMKPLYGDGEVRRVLQSQGGKVVGSDVETPDFAIEAKHGKSPPYKAALIQAERDNPPPRSRWPVAIIKADNEAAVVVMRLESFVALVRKMRGLD